MFVFEVTINGLGAANHAALGLVLGEVLGQEAGVSVRIVASDDNETIKVERDRIFERVFELLGRLDFVTART